MTFHHTGKKVERLDSFLVNKLTCNTESKTESKYADRQADPVEIFMI